MKQAGDDVAMDEPLFEVSTAIGDLVIHSPAVGVLASIDVAVRKGFQIRARRSVDLAVIRAATTLPAANVTNLTPDLGVVLAPAGVTRLAPAKNASVSSVTPKEVLSGVGYALFGVGVEIALAVLAARHPGPTHFGVYLGAILFGPGGVFVGLADVFRVWLSKRGATTAALIVACAAVVAFLWFVLPR